MPTWLKVVLAVVGLLVVLVVAAAVVTFVVVRRYGPGLVEAGKQAVEEAHDYGRRTDNESCVNEAAARHSRTEGIGAMIKNGIFLRGCLEASRPTPGFCDAVPNRFEFVRIAQWQLEECRRYSLPPEKQCGQLFQQVQEFCEHRRLTPGVVIDNSNSDDEPPPPPPAPRQPANRR